MPTIINLVVTAFIVMELYSVKNEALQQVGEKKHVDNTRDAAVASALLIAVVASLVVNDLMALSGLPHVEHRGFIPFIMAAGGYFLVSNPRDVLRRVDWGTTVFFMAMFITISEVWRSGVLSPLLSSLMPHKNAWPLDYLGMVLCSLS